MEQEIKGRVVKPVLQLRLGYGGKPNGDNCHYSAKQPMPPSHCQGGLLQPITGMPFHRLVPATKKPSG
jgi:hypothetical protein